MKRRLFYFGLEPLKARYTYQLCKEWMPATFEPYSDKLEFIEVDGEFDPDQEIKVGAVLDAIGRGKYSLTQCESFLKMIYDGVVRDGDIIYLQDYWTPGLDAIWYALDLYGINVKVYAMLHAQSVDEYDFTYPMRDWMRHYELGLDKRMTGIFVGSTVHKEQLRDAGFTSPIHVVSLPIHKEATLNKLPNYSDDFAPGIVAKQNVIVYSSRLDKEKNPFFMMKVAKEFLSDNPSWEWHVTTSGKEFRSMLPGVIDALNALAAEEPRFKLLSGLTKEEYYTELATCRIQFNTSLQDYVSWTVIEATAFGADIIYPKFRSFPEFIDESRMYKPFDWRDAIQVMRKAIIAPRNHYDIVDTSDLGRRMEGYIIANDYDKEICVWHEKEYCQSLLDTEKVNNKQLELQFK
jgi:glycosyltransferase involved in cell wall biosynthesis